MNIRDSQVLDIKKSADILGDIVQELGREMRAEDDEPRKKSVPPFDVSWMDSWVAHWVFKEQVETAERQSEELATVLRSLVDLKFNERLAELHHFIRDYGGVISEPPDGGPPEPGPPPEPPAGPSAWSPVGEPPDGGPPEPGPPPEPPEPPAGPEPGGFQYENPWILYWFVSIKAPLLLDVIDAHITRRLEALQAQADRTRS